MCGCSVRRGLSNSLPALIVLVGLFSAAAGAQTASTDTDTRAQVGQLRNQLAATQNQLDDAKAQIEQLRTELQQIKTQLGLASGSSKPADQTGAYPTLQNAVKESTPGTATSEDQQILAARVDEQAQTKVESASKYKVRLSGLILMNTYSNFGSVDVSDLPNLALSRPGAASTGETGATLRQTQLGLEVAGPQFAGAASGGDLQADFFGGFPDVNYGVTDGLFRLRIARGYLNWGHTKLVAGQDEPFFSPLSPTSYATLAEPAFAWAGNLWVWTPQIRVEHKWDLSDRSSLGMEFGILDALTEVEPPDQFKRMPTPGEASRVPAFGWHGSWNSKIAGRNASLGLGSYYSRQSFTFNRHVDGWGVMADYNLPLASKVVWSGEVFRGRALGGLGGGIWNSVVYSGAPSLATSQVIGLNDIGGWSQLKLIPVSKLEFNVAAGTDNPFANDIEFFPNPTGTYFPPLARNQTIFGNSIYRPRSNLLVAFEYRHLRTYSTNGTKKSADHLNLALGVSF